MAFARNHHNLLLRRCCLLVLALIASHPLAHGGASNLLLASPSAKEDSVRTMPAKTWLAHTTQELLELRLKQYQSSKDRRNRRRAELRAKKATCMDPKQATLFAAAANGATRARHPDTATCTIKATTTRNASGWVYVSQTAANSNQGDGRQHGIVLESGRRADPALQS